MKEELRAAEDELAAAEAARDALLAQVPNPPDPSAPDGDTDEDAVELRRVGEPTPDGPGAHRDRPLRDGARGAALGLALRLPRRRHGAARAGALPLRARPAAAHGHTPLIPPVLVREEAMYGTGFFPTERSNIYALEDDDLYLTGTSEVALAGFHMDEILDELPLRYAGFSTCFRRESGAAGKDTRGMFRVHQFNKVELFVFCEPERSGEEHDRLLAIEEELVARSASRTASSTSLPATSARRPRRSTTSRRWFPLQQRYREITSTSNTTDFQARRLGIRYRAGEKGPRRRTRSTAPRSPTAGCSRSSRTSAARCPTCSGARRARGDQAIGGP